MTQSSVSLTWTETSTESVPTTCLGECCSAGHNELNQPRSRRILDAMIMTVNGQKRSVNGSWFDHYTWLTLYETRNVLLCHFCVEANCRGLITFSTKGDDAFVKNGFIRWKNSLEYFNKHEASRTHKEALVKINSAAGIVLVQFWMLN